MADDRQDDPVEPLLKREEHLPPLGAAVVRFVEHQRPHPGFGQRRRQRGSALESLDLRIDLGVPRIGGAGVPVVYDLCGQDLTAAVSDFVAAIQALILLDGFETGNTDRWSATTGQGP